MSIELMVFFSIQLIFPLESEARIARYCKLRKEEESNQVGSQPFIYSF